MPLSVTQLKERRQQADREWAVLKPLYDEAYEFAIPFRRGIRETGQGDKRVNRIFDMTATASAFRGAGRLQQDFCPPGEPWVRFEPGPLVPAGRERNKLTKHLAEVSEVVGSLFQTGEWDMACHEMCLDLQAGTGALLMDDAPANNRGRLAAFASVPAEEVRLEMGLFGDIIGRFWCRKVKGSLIRVAWPKAELSRKLAERIEKEPEKEIEVHQDTTFDYETGKWTLHVSHDDDEAPFWTRDYRTSPWLTPRYFRVPGETWGRGPILLAMPAIKTLNKAQELTLKAAAITMLGIYTATEDGVFNPATAMVAPGQFWKVRANGGVLGPSIQKLPEPRLDLSNIVLNELRMSVQTALMDQSLPPDGAAVRSATEILERVKRLASDHQGAAGRLVHEIVVPAGQRGLEICYDAKVIPHMLEVDQLLLKTRVTSPFATARFAARAQAGVQWIEMAMAIAPGYSDLVVNKLDALIDVGRGLGVPESWIPSAERREAIMEQVTALVAQAMAAAETASQAQPAAPPANAAAGALA
ncbi:portal protein [Ancylobacter sp. IITR112]|uniref:portal protein n=1 Tax=Ancylobacter sp. IITR112 TaxID=3138073 RepID=UPI00352A0B1D